MRAEKKINLFEYLDYRKYLRDYYEAAKKTRAGFSFRSFSQKAGFGSSNFYKLVMDGDRNLTQESLLMFARGLSLNKQELEFFRNLVCFNQSKDHQDKDAFYQKILQSRKFIALKPMEKEQYEFYSTWHHSVIRELIQSPEFDGSYEWLAKKVSPSLTVLQVQNSISILEKIGFIKKDDSGKWKQTHSLVTTGPETASLAMMNYHKNLLELSRDILAEIPSGQRDVSSLTLGIEKSQLPLIKKKIQQFRREILEMVSQDVKTEEVVFLNIQMFPMTDAAEGKKS